MTIMNDVKQTTVCVSYESNNSLEHDNKYSRSQTTHGIGLDAIRNYLSQNAF